MMIFLIYMKYGPETPPNTPQHAQAAAHQNEHDNCNLDSPQHCHIPQHANPPQIPPLHFNNIPIPQAPLLPDPDDPFAPPPPPVQQYQHLSQHLAQQPQNLPALAPAGRGHLIAVSVKIDIYLFSLFETFKPQYNHLPAHLAQQLAALPPLAPQGKGRGRGRGQIPPVPVPAPMPRGHHPLPPVPAPAPVSEHVR